MARNAFARGERSSSAAQYSEDNEPLLTREKDVASVGGTEGFEFYSVMKNKRPRKRKTRPSAGSSTSDDPRENDRRSRPRSRVKTGSLPSGSRSSVTRPTEERNIEERQSLLRSGETSTRYGTSEAQDEVQELEAGGRVPNTSTRYQTTERFLSVVLFLFVLVGGMVLVVSSNIKSDEHSLHISPRSVNCYAVVLILIYLLWLVASLWRNRQASESTREESGPLIPCHLLNGLVLFGVGSSVCHVVTILDFLKCGRFVRELDTTYVVYPSFEMVFMFSQLYMLYTLSQNRKRKLWYGSAFTMFTLAINLNIWAIYFFAGAVNNSQLKNETWLTHYYYGVADKDLCSQNNNSHKNSNESKKLHEFRSGMQPFMYTLSMEYALLASALLLHLWLEIATPNAGEYGEASKKNWQIWRFGLIVGLFFLPFIGVMAVNATVDFVNHKIMVMYLAELLLFVILFVSSVWGISLLKSHYVAETKPVIRVDIILLCISWLGFLVIDLFSVFATCAEIFKKFDWAEFVIGIASLGELLTTATITAFIVFAYARKLPVTLNQETYHAAKLIRQIGSFSVIVSFGFWAMRTYTFRVSYTFDVVGSKYFNGLSWFVITQLSVPFCTFFHFHSAVCLTEVIAASTI